jgi:hypothetical protein
MMVSNLYRSILHLARILGVDEQGGKDASSGLESIPHGSIDQPKGCGSRRRKVPNNVGSVHTSFVRTE